MNNIKLKIFIETLSIVFSLLIIYFGTSLLLIEVFEVSQTLYLIIFLLIIISIIFICLFVVSGKRAIRLKHVLNKLRFKKITRITIYQAIVVFLISVVLSCSLQFFIDYFNIFFTGNSRFEIAKFHKQNESSFFLILTVLITVIFAPLQEEVLFRGYMLQKQEFAFGKYAWILNGFTFILAHLLVYDFVNLILISPLSFLVAYKVQKYKNTSIGLLAHLFVNIPFVIKLLIT